MSPRRWINHSGFTAIEVMMALCLLTVALLSFAGLSAMTLRRITDSRREMHAAELTRRLLERIAAAPCANSAGSDSVNAVGLHWTVSTTGHTATVDQHVHYPIAAGIHDDSLRSVVACR